MNPLLEEIYRTRQCVDTEGKTLDPFTASVSWNDGMALYNNIVEIKARKTLETGMAYGLSTLFMCQALKDNGGGLHVAIDPDERTEWRSVGIFNVERAGLQDLFRFCEEPSELALPGLIREGETFDVAFIDGLHRFDGVLMDFMFVDKLLQPGGRIVFHDTFMPSVRKALAFIMRNTTYEPVSAYNGGPARFWEWVGGTARNLLESPYDLYASFFLRRLPFKPNIFVIRKTAEDTRGWKHYVSF